jgi:hypothetical protein
MIMINPNMLEYAWTAEVELNNGQEITIWWTAWPMSKQGIKNILWIASDYPRYKLNIV